MKTLIVILGLWAWTASAVEIGDIRLSSIPTKEGCLILVPNNIELSECTLSPILSASDLAIFTCTSLAVNVACDRDAVLGPVNESKYDWAQQ